MVALEHLKLDADILERNIGFSDVAILSSLD
jgi:hypothetical protein